MDYFGDPWLADECVGGIRQATPVGQLCWWCETGIVEGDRGFWTIVGRVGSDGELFPSREPGHRECDLRSKVGGMQHLLRRCRCYGGTEDERRPFSPQQRRSEAITVWEMVRRGVVLADPD